MPRGARGIERSRFVDSAVIHARGGRGGAGAVSFRREPYVPRGGPDGGDGGRGGSVVLRASEQVSSLLDFVTRPTRRAADGRPGAAGLKAGKAGEDLLLPVPPGTAVLDQDGNLVADLVRDGETAVIAKGGEGGRGNVHFKSSVKRAPDYAEPGSSGEDLELRLELRLIADAALVGAPNAGKSSLLRAVSNATPKVGDWAFTTLEPELGVAITPSGSRLTLADIPGLIPGAASGAGLGVTFLRHLERTRVLVLVLDGASDDPFQQLVQLRSELQAHQPGLESRAHVVVVNKLDLDAVRRLKASTADPSVLFCSALTGEGVGELLRAIEATLATVPRPSPPKLIRLKPPRGAAEPITVERSKVGFTVKGGGVEALVARTNFASAAQLDHFQVQLDRLGVNRRLEEAGAQAGDNVEMAGMEFEYRP